MLNIEVAKRWADRLESHPEELGVKAKLSNGTQFCVWGVLTNLFAEEVGEKWVQEDENTASFREMTYCIPVEVLEWVDPARPCSIVKGGVSLIELYEEYNYSAQQLAQVIRENIDAVSTGI